MLRLLSNYTQKQVIISLIDCGYRDELGIIMSNTSEVLNYSAEDIFSIDEKGNKRGTYKIKKGDRAAQIVLQAVPRMRFTVVGSVKDIGTDRGGGFGSTGVR